MSKGECKHGEINCGRCADVDFQAPTIHLNIILDVSPSMLTRWSQTISGLNEYIDSLRKDQTDNDQAYKVSMSVFSAGVEKIYDEVELDAIPRFTQKNLEPHGWGTALYDAVGKTIKAINTTSPVLVIIVTDGEENSSVTWDESRVGALLDERQKLGNYTYAYLGVAKDAWGNAAKVPAFQSSSNNMAASNYTSGTWSDHTKGLAGLTACYSSMIRTRSAAAAPGVPATMSVTNLFEPDSWNTQADFEPSLTPTTTTGK